MHDILYDFKLLRLPFVSLILGGLRRQTFFLLNKRNTIATITTAMLEITMTKTSLVTTGPIR